MQDYWLKQATNKPLFPNLLWSRPENKKHAGKLAVVGGNAHGFAAAGDAYAAANKAGVGACRVLLPDSLSKSVGRVFEAGEYGPSTPSGSFGRQSLSELISLAEWADAVLLAGDFGRNSETAILLEQVVQKYKGLLAITLDGLDYFTKLGMESLNSPKVLIVASFGQLQKIATTSHFETALTFEMDFIRLIEALHKLSQKYKTLFITKHLDTVFVAVNGQVSTTKLATDQEVWRVKTAASATTWWLQNPHNSFEALTTSLIS